jgi:hypothetical protein
VARPGHLRRRWADARDPAPLHRGLLNQPSVFTTTLRGHSWHKTPLQHLWHKTPLQHF